MFLQTQLNIWLHETIGIPVQSWSKLNNIFIGKPQIQIEKLPVTPQIWVVFLPSRWSRPEKCFASKPIA